MINAADSRHANVQLADQLRAKIEAGEIQDKLPSITELIAASGLTTNTVQRALRILKGEGLIYGVPGRGTFVHREGYRPR